MKDDVLVIPTTDLKEDAFEYLEALLFSIVGPQRLDASYEIVVCHDGVSDEFYEIVYLKYPELTHLRWTGNRRNFSATVNMGLRYAFQKGKNALVVNQDTVLPAFYWLEQVLDTEGIRVPHEVNVIEGPPINEKSLCKLTEEQLKVEDLKVERHNRIVGFCMGINYKVMEKIGYINEFYPSTFSDDDYCARALVAGFPIEAINVKVQHFGSKMGSYGGPELALGILKFKLDWCLPEDLEHANFNSWILENRKWDDRMYCP